MIGELSGRVSENDLHFVQRDLSPFVENYGGFAMIHEPSIKGAKKEY